MRRSRAALLLFLGTFAAGLHTADVVPSPHSAAADFGPRVLPGSRRSPDDEARPDWCLPSPAIDALTARRDAPQAESPRYAPAARKVAGRVKRPAPASSIDGAVSAAARPADLPCSAEQPVWTCPLAQPLTETELERGARPSVAMRTSMSASTGHPADLPRREALPPLAPQVVRGDLSALARDPRHSTGCGLALRLNAAADGLSRKVAVRPRDSYSRRYDYPFDYDCLPVGWRGRDRCGAECNADDSYASARAWPLAKAIAAAAGETGIVREDLREQSSAATAGLRQVMTLLSSGARLTRDWGAAAMQWREWLVDAATTAMVESARADATGNDTDAGQPPTTRGAYLGL